MNSTLQNKTLAETAKPIRHTSGIHPEEKVSSSKLIQPNNNSVSQDFSKTPEETKLIENDAINSERL